MLTYADVHADSDEGMYVILTAQHNETNAAANADVHADEGMHVILTAQHNESPGAHAWHAHEFGLAGDHLT